MRCVNVINGGFCCHSDKIRLDFLRSLGSGVRFSDPKTSRARKPSRKAPETTFGCFSKRTKISGQRKSCTSLFPINFTGTRHLPKTFFGCFIWNKMAGIGALLTRQPREYIVRTSIANMRENEDCAPREFNGWWRYWRTNLSVTQAATFHWVQRRRWALLN